MKDLSEQFECPRQRVSISCAIVFSCGLCPVLQLSLSHVDGALVVWHHHQPRSHHQDMTVGFTAMSVIILSIAAFD